MWGRRFSKGKLKKKEEKEKRRKKKREEKERRKRKKKEKEEQEEEKARVRWGIEGGRQEEAVGREVGGWRLLKAPYYRRHIVWRLHWLMYWSSSVFLSLHVCVGLQSSFCHSTVLGAHKKNKKRSRLVCLQRKLYCIGHNNTNTTRELSD